MDYPTPWPDKRHEPMLPVTMTTTRDQDCIYYTVEVTSNNSSAFEEGEDQVCVWRLEVPFASSRGHALESGGPAFQYAAKEQERVASEWCEFLLNPPGP